MVSHLLSVLAVFTLATLTQALRYDPSQIHFNLNNNKTATDPLNYSGAWPDHDFFPSPSNWRMPMYTIFLDRFVNGWVAGSSNTASSWS